MADKGGNIFEKNADKIILGVICIVCLFVLIRTFVMSPNKAEINGNTFSPGTIDRQVYQNSQKLQGKIESLAKKDKEDYPENEKTKRFMSFLEYSIRDMNDARLVINENMYLPLPSRSADGAVQTRVYVQPKLAKLSDAQAGLYRSVAFMPMEKVDMDHPYGTVNTEMKDLDFVTVQAKFDVKTLYDNFYESFLGRSVKDNWRDKQLAQPVFARVQLQRQQLNRDGSWSDWQDVPQTQIDEYRTLFNLPDKISDLDSSGVRTMYARLNSPEVRTELLQPRSYDFAYPEYEWISPEFEKVRQKQIEKEKEMLRRQSAAPERPEAARPTRERRTREPAGGAGAAPAGGAVAGRERTPITREPRVNRTVRAAAPGATTERTADRVAEQESPEDDFYDVQLENIEDLSQAENLVLWAHDDSTAPGKSYRYRIRLGIANPIAGVAGAKWADENSDDDRLIFWSDYADSDEVIEIPRRTYIFATDVKREADKTVSIEVARYMLGNWNKHEFIVKPGDLIGSEMEIKKDSVPTDRRDEQETIKVDFSTGSSMLDLVQSMTWTGKSLLTARSYYEVLYSSDDGAISRSPVKRTFWDKNMSRMYIEIEDSMANPVSLSQSRSERGGARRTTPVMPGNTPAGPGMPGMF